MTTEEFEELLTHLDALVAEFEAHGDPGVSARALDLLRHVDAIHREGLGRLVELIHRRYPQLVEEVAQDGVVHILLSLYDLAPSPPTGAFIPLARLEASAAAARSRMVPRP